MRSEIRKAELLTICLAFKAKICRTAALKEGTFHSHGSSAGGSNHIRNNRQRELTALNRQGTQQRPESPYHRRYLQLARELTQDTQTPQINYIRL